VYNIGLTAIYKYKIKVKKTKKAVLSQREPRDAAVNFDTCRILQWHRAVSLPQHAFLVYQRPFKCWNYTQYADFHGRDRE